MPPWSVAYIRFAFVNLVVGATVGGALLVMPSRMPRELVDVHIELLLLGWFLPLAMGVASWILPRLPRPPRHGSARLGWLSFVLCAAGVTSTAIVQLAGGQGLAVASTRLITAAGCGTFIVYIAPRIRAFGAG